jgi:hypothetical protein
MLNNFGEALSPYLTPILASNVSYFYPSIVTTPLLLRYILELSILGIKVFTFYLPYLPTMHYDLLDRRLC